MINIAICDDEERMRVTLAAQVNTYMACQSNEFQVFSFANAETLLRSNVFFDIVFLDIQMNDVTGMEAALKLREMGSKCFIIFITVLKEYVYNAFEVDASDYLLKPVDEHRLYRTLDRILKTINHHSENYLIIKKENSLKTIRFEDIVYCEAINRKIFVHTLSESINYYYKIGELEKQLDHSFFRCHRSYLVNLKYVCGYENGMTILENGEHIPVSRLRQQAFATVVLDYMKAGRK
ncbi:LytR/AlgR family response regulator transcription factor [Fusibacter bizertensis]